MNRLVLILFLIVLVFTLIVGFFYLSQTQNLSLTNLLPSSYTPVEKVTPKASQNCKSSGFGSAKDAGSYLYDLMLKTGTDKNKGGYLQIIDLGNTCWGIWAGDKNGNGTLFWEDNQGKINQAKAKVQI